MHAATIGLQNSEMIILLLFQQEEKSFTETERLFFVLEGTQNIQHW